GVGLCSYFLIGFWFKREDAAEASKKAFVVNRIGDMGFLLGMTLIFLTTGTLKYFGDANAKGVLDQAATTPNVFSTGLVADYAQVFGISGVVLITLLLFVGCCGKSAQLPLFTWLPDAMAGPTPVSALIHAATMVTAGVYICARSAALFDLAPETKLIIAVVGAATAVVAGLTALAHNDIKKVLAYSTVSQLGIMFVGIGAGAYSAAIFHVFTHAFFKACLFLGAGSVIHALHGEQDMRKMGGLKAKMKLTNITFLLSGLALAGAVPFSGFFSKDEIIGHAYHEGGIYQIIALAMLVVAFITALYTGRQYGQVFGGKARDEHLAEHAHESSSVMTLPLIVLAIGAVFAGFLGLPHINGLPQMHALTDWLSPVFPRTESVSPDLMMLAAGAVVGWLGWILGLGLGKNAGRALLPEASNRFSLDALYNLVFGRGGFALTRVARWVDDKVIDGAVNAVGGAVGLISGVLRQTQTSFVRNYALGMALGAIVLIALFAVNR
ncbi:MAG TPA: NADH-quinone oxidoreductase subunit L, partial [Abditibacteriaceae bacterium]|nr:NADH-quinone oxidoreductase subunit L [Abditibacteriaceae bacterium]